MTSSEYEKLTPEQRRKFIHKSLNYSRYIAINRTIHAAHLLAYSTPADILSEADLTSFDLISLKGKLLNATRELSHSYVLCPTCRKALTGNSARKDSKQSTYDNCQICDSSIPLTENYYHYKYTSRKYTLKQAKAKLNQTHPELFI
jgi:hypothetical protein